MRRLYINNKCYGVYDIKRGVLEYHSFRTEKHFFRKFNGFGISWSVLTYLQALATKFKCEKINIFIHYKQDNKEIIYFAPAFKFFKSEKSYTDDTSKTGDFQKILSLDEFSIIKEK